MYVVVEKIVNNPFITTTSNRVGVPQHFGIYYAIGELQEEVVLLTSSFKNAVL